MIDKKILEVLNNGELVILPTDTVYGIHADATSVDAIRKVDEAKHSNKPHLMLVSSISMLEKYTKEISYFGGNLEIRILRYNSDKHELYSGDQKGKITVWSLKTGQSIYAWQAHSGAITQMRYDKKSKRLLSMAKDKKIIYWQIPDSWVSDTVKKFEENSIREINANRAAERLKKYNKENEDDSDDDSLDGWDIEP